MQRIAGSNVHVFKAIQSAREALKLEGNPLGSKSETVTIASKVAFPDADQGVKLVINPFTIDTLQAASDMHKAMLGFLFAQRWALAPRGEQGITWIECLVLFFLHGVTYQLAGMPPAFECESRASMRKHLLTFNL